MMRGEEKREEVEGELRHIIVLYSRTHGLLILSLIIK